MKERSSAMRVPVVLCCKLEIFGVFSARASVVCVRGEKIVFLTEKGKLRNNGWCFLLFCQPETLNQKTCCYPEEMNVG